LFEDVISSNLYNSLLVSILQIKKLRLVTNWLEITPIIGATEQALDFSLADFSTS